MSKQFDIFQKRLKNRGATEMERMEADKLASFQDALRRSYNSETVENRGVSTKAIISGTKVNMTEDTKIISTVLEDGYKVGDTVYWPRTSTYWLIVTQYLTEKTLFRGDMRKALYKIRWRDEQGAIHEAWASTKGPTEDDVKVSTGGGLIVETADDSMTLWIGFTDGATALQRGKSLMVAGKVWDVTNINPITTPGLLKISLKESVRDDDQDNVAEQIARDYEHMTAINNPKEIAGLDKVDPIIGLSQTYTVTPVDPLGTWAIDPTFGVVAIGTPESAVVEFTGKIGLVDLTYSANGTLITKKTIKVTSIFG